MNRIAQASLLLSGIFIALSAIPHFFLAWPAMNQKLLDLGAGNDLRHALFIGWSFGSVAMLVMGLLLGATWHGLKRGHASLNIIPLVMGSAYLLFGLAAFVYRDYNSHFFFFIIPGAMALLGSRYRAET